MIVADLPLYQPQKLPWQIHEGEGRQLLGYNPDLLHKLLAPVVMPAGVKLDVAWMARGLADRQDWQVFRRELVTGVLVRVHNARN